MSVRMAQSVRVGTTMSVRRQWEVAIHLPSFCCSPTTNLNGAVVQVSACRGHACMRVYVCMCVHVCVYVCMRIHYVYKMHRPHDRFWIEQMQGIAQGQHLHRAQRVQHMTIMSHVA